MRSFQLDADRVVPVSLPPVEEIDYSGPNLVTDLRTLSDAVLSRRKLVAATAAAALLLAFGYVWVTPPTYSSTAEVLIDPRQQQVFEQAIVPAGMGSSSLGADTFLLDSQVEVILSQSILRQVVVQQGLADDPEFGGSGSDQNILKRILKLVLMGPQASGIQSLSPEDRALETLREGLDVFRKGNTYVMGVSVESENPTKAADLANAITGIYMNEINSYTRTKISDVEDLLGGRLAELREAALASQRRVESYRAENGLLSTAQLPVIEQQLRDLNQQLSLVATTANAARARWEAVAQLEGRPVDELLASGAVDSPLMNTLRQQHATLSAREASLAATLARRHPSLQAVRDSMASVRAEMHREVARLISRYRVDFDVAGANEVTIREQIDRLEDATAESNQASVTLRDLEREAESDTAIYQIFLTRSKDAREQVNLPTEAVRVISKAFPEFKPTWPKVPLVLAAALAVGLALGTGIALLLHLFGATPRVAERPRTLLGEARA